MRPLFIMNSALICFNVAAAHAEDMRSFLSQPRTFGHRPASPIGWQFVEVYEYVNHVKGPFEAIKANPMLQILAQGVPLRPTAGRERAYLWVAALPPHASGTHVQYRFGPELQMPANAPMGGSAERPKKPKYGHATLALKERVLSGGEIHFLSSGKILINNDSGRINRFFPNSDQERGAFCDSVGEIQAVTGHKFEIVWINFVALQLSGDSGAVANFSSFGKQACPNVP